MIRIRMSDHIGTEHSVIIAIIQSTEHWRSTVVEPSAAATIWMIFRERGDPVAPRGD